MCPNLTCPFYLAVSGRLAEEFLGLWERGPVQPSLAAAQVETWLEGHTAATGSGWSCW